MNKQFWNPGIRNLKPYVPGEQLKIEGLIKLNTNENPYPPSNQVLTAIRNAVSGDLRRYPDSNGQSLKLAIAKKFCLSEDQIFLGNGSDEVLGHIFLGLLKHDDPILFPDVSYSFYPVYCGLYGIEYKTIPVNERFEIPVEPFLRPNGGVLITNPNAPTGMAMPLVDIRRIVENNSSSVVVIDEAYVDYGGESSVSLINEFPNLIVVQTFSKSRSLAGLRVGFALGNPSLIAALNVVKDCFNSYPIDRLALAGAEASINDTAYVDECLQKVIQSRVWLSHAMTDMGFEVLPSKTNFIFAHHPHHDAKQLYLELRQRKVLVRHFPLPRIDNFLRISVGTDQECRVLVEQLRDILYGNPRQIHQHSA